MQISLNTIETDKQETLEEQSIDNIKDSRSYGKEKSKGKDKCYNSL